MRHWIMTELHASLMLEELTLRTQFKTLGEWGRVGAAINPWKSHMTTLPYLRSWPLVELHVNIPLCLGAAIDPWRNMTTLTFWRAVFLVTSLVANITHALAHTPHFAQECWLLGHQPVGNTSNWNNSNKNVVINLDLGLRARAIQ